MVTTLIATVFTGLPSADHFNRFAPFSLISNILALPLVSFVVMPLAVVSTLLMPFGLETWPLQGIGWALDVVIAIAEWVAALPSAGMAVPSFSTWAALLLGLGITWACLWQGRLRLAGLAPAVIALPLLFDVASPDILIERAGKNVAARDEHGRIVPALDRRARFVTGKWLLSDGDTTSPRSAAARPLWNCGNAICRASVKSVTVLYARAAAEKTLSTALCAGVDVLIAEFPLRGRCIGVAERIDRFDLWRHGAHAIYLSGRQVRIETARDRRGNRPWVVEPVARYKIRLNGDYTVAAQ
jgi:competence protein ComEC